MAYDVTVDNAFEENVAKNVPSSAKRLSYAFCTGSKRSGSSFDIHSFIFSKSLLNPGIIS